ncbi:MAG TPA: AgmX/PglI C-terminal domain-containing protein [Polyangiales bacterium]|nr:AgmX/PglI C-terminal domain-containing protein [Polyangiales bacterium]
MPAPAVDADTRERLSRAANVMEYENVWRDAHPQATLGTLRRDELRALVRERTPELQRCYEAALDRLPGGRGHVAVRFVIDASGKVPSVHVGSSDFDSPEVACCLANHIAGWTLPAPQGGDFVVVEYPFNVRISHGP